MTSNMTISRPCWCLLAGLLGWSLGLADAQGQAPPPAPVVETLPAKPPAWLAGFRIRYPLRVAGDSAAYTAKTVIASLPTGGWLKPDGSDLAVQAASGQVLPVSVLSHDPAGATLIQFPRQANERWYWAYAINAKAAPAKASPAPEGMTLELRDWAGDDMSSWPMVLAGLKKSEKVIGNAWVADVIQNCNPARPDDPSNFVASYRGQLDIKKAGVYRFFLNADDASFLFIDGAKVCERVGANERKVGQIPRRSVGTDVELKVGIHPLEIHQVVGKNPEAIGYCTLLWLPPGQNGWSFVPRTEFVQSLYAEVAALEEAGGNQAACFAYGVDDTLTSSGITLYLTRFEAQGTIKDPTRLTWDFGDGTTGSGRSAMHVYFKGGPYTVTLRSADTLPLFRRTVYVWPAPHPTSPLSLGVAVKTLAAMEWKKFDPRLKQMFDFLLICEQSERWPLLEKVARELLTLKDFDPKQRVAFHTALWEAMAVQGRGREALALVEPALQEYAKLPSLRVSLKLAAAEITGRYLKDAAEASRLFQLILEENRRLDHPKVRLAAIRWGDLYAESGDLAKAAESYRLASTLGDDKTKNTAQAQAITRGALLRIAEQKLRGGDVHQCQILLERIEVDYPEQKLEGLYRFLRAEADRLGGRYEEAIRNYEFLLKLTQWAGYRDRALYGIADSYFHMADYDKALEWLSTVKESFPKFYEKQKLPAYQAMIEGRRNRQKLAGGKDTGFKGFRTSFEPEDKQPLGELVTWSIIPSLGFGGSYVCRFEELPVGKTTPIYKIPLKDITSNGHYWVEFWYRDSLHGSYLGHLIVPQLQIYLYGPGTEYHPEGGGLVTYMERSRGQWRKFGVKLKTGVTQDGLLGLFLYYGVGMLEIDSLSVLPVSDRQNDSLHSFIEGADKQ